MSHFPLIKDSKQKDHVSNNNNFSKAPISPQDKVVKELSQTISGRQRAQSVSTPVPKIEEAKGKEGKEVVVLSSQKSDPTGKQEEKETESTKKYATLKFPSPFQKGHRPRAMSIFPEIQGPETLSPQFRKLEVKRFSHETQSMKIDPKEFGKSFLNKAPVDQLKEIFQTNFLTLEQREKKSRALIYVCDELFEVKDLATGVFTCKLSL